MLGESLNTIKEYIAIGCVVAGTGCCLAAVIYKSIDLHNKIKKEPKQLDMFKDIKTYKP